MVRKCFIILALGITVGFVSYFAFQALNLIFIKHDINANAQLLSSFLGAFLAFLFVRLGEGLRRIYERQAKNHTTLIELQHIHNANINTIHDNLYLCGKLVEAFNKVTENGMPLLVPNKIMPLQTDFERLTRLTNLDVINSAFRFYTNIKKFNEDADSFNESYADLRNDLRAGKIDIQTYRVNIPGFLHIVEALKKFLVRCQRENFRLLATIRADSDVPTVLGWIINLITKERIDACKKRKILRQLKALRKELRDTAA